MNTKWGESKEPDEVELTQYLPPNGLTRIVRATVGEEYAKKAEGLIFSTEVLATGVVVVYGRKVGQSEENEISEFAENGPGENNPTAVLKRVIDRLVEPQKEYIQ